MRIGENYFLAPLSIFKLMQKPLVSNFKFEIRNYNFPKMLKILEMSGDIITNISGGLK